VTLSAQVRYAQSFDSFAADQNDSIIIIIIINNNNNHNNHLSHMLSAPKSMVPLPLVT
jgi:hypothetical protein